MANLLHIESFFSLIFLRKCLKMLLMRRSKCALTSFCGFTDLRTEINDVFEPFLGEKLH